MPDVYSTPARVRRVMLSPPNIFRDSAALKAKGGYVYIMSNPSLAGNLLKIGKSDNHPSERKKQLETTGVPGSFVIEYYIKVENHDELERNIHHELRQQRPNKAREFFDVSVPVAIAKIRGIVKGQKYDETVLYRSPDEVRRETERIERDRRETERIENEARRTAERFGRERRATERFERERLEKEREIGDRMNTLSRDLTEILRETRIKLENGAKDRDMRTLGWVLFCWELYT